MGQLEVINPSNEEVIDVLRMDDDLMVVDKVKMAQEALEDWRETPLEERIEIIEHFAEVLEEKRDIWAEDLSREMGKPLPQARGEFSAVVKRIQFFTEAARTELIPRLAHGKTGGALWEEVSPEPLGVIANISAWNYPVFVGVNVFVPALLAGNVVVYKPSEYAPQTGLNMSQAWFDAGLSQEYFNPIMGDAFIGSELVKQPVDGLFFTGSYATGMKISQAMAGRFARLQLELGGKDPAYVRPDVDIQTAAGGLAEGAFYNTGQSCCAVERIYVHASVYDDFVKAFVDSVSSFKMGDPFEEGVFIGPLTREEQLPVLQGQVDDALAKGANLALGGKRREGRGYFYEPTVLTNVDHSMQVMQEETFGPVIGIQKVADDAEALQKMNDTRYGLTASVFTRDEEVARGLMGKLQAGTVYWNCCDRVSPFTPWTGWKDSGVGSTLGLEGLRNMVKPKAWHFRKPG